MPSIRLFGRGRGGAAQTAHATGVTSEHIGDALAALTTASLSATWRCRHTGASAVAIGEGAVDFDARRSRATVIRGKNAFEYVRDGSSVLRTPILGTAADRPRAAAKPVRDVVTVSLDAYEDENEDTDADADEKPDTTDEDASAEAVAADGDGAEDTEDEDEDEDEPGDDASRNLEDDAADGEEEDEDAEDDGEQDSDDDADADADAEYEDEDDSDVDTDTDTDTALTGQASDKSTSGQDSGAPQWVVFSDLDACGPHAYAEPAVLAAAVRAAGAVQARKSEDIDGVAHPAFSVTVKPRPNDPDKTLARLARHLRDHGANTLTVTAFLRPDADTASDADGRDAARSEDGAGDDADDAAPEIVRLRLELAHWTPADDPTADHIVTVDLYELGDAVEIEVPDRRAATRRTQRTCADLALF